MNFVEITYYRINKEGTGWEPLTGYVNLNEISFLTDVVTRVPIAGKIVPFQEKDLYNVFLHGTTGHFIDKLQLEKLKEELMINQTVN